MSIVKLGSDEHSMKKGIREERKMMEFVSFENLATWLLEFRSEPASASPTNLQLDHFLIDTYQLQENLKRFEEKGHLQGVEILFLSKFVLKKPRLTNVL